MKRKIGALDVYVIFSITVLIIYTIVSQYMAYTHDVELNVLTTCFFGFFGGEVATCALIKIFKLKEENKPQEEEVG